MKIINSLFKWMYQRRKKNLVEALTNFVSRQELNKLIARTPDRREIVKAASSLIGYSEQELIFLISEKLNLPVTFQLVEGLAAFKNEEREGFFLAGACPLAQHGEVVGLACVDPLLCDEVLPNYSNTPKWLTSWDAIKIAHYENSTTKAQSPSGTSSNIGKKVISSILKESRKFQGQKIAIQMGELVKYEILTIDNKTAKGKISEKARQSLEEYLLFTVPSGVIEPDEALELPFIRITHNETLNRYILEWDASYDQEEIKLNEKNNIVTFPKHHKKKEPTKRNSKAIKPQILVVEDNETFTKVLDRFLKKNGVEAIFAKDGREGLIMLEKSYQMIRAIICDVHMPRMNGFEFIKTVRANQNYNSLPCVMLTSDTDVETELSLLNEGVDVFIGKQQDPRILCFHINRIISKSGIKAA